MNDAFNATRALNNSIGGLFSIVQYRTLPATAYWLPSITNPNNLRFAIATHYRLLASPLAPNPGRLDRNTMLSDHCWRGRERRIGGAKEEFNGGEVMAMSIELIFNIASMIAIPLEVTGPLAITNLQSAVS